MVLSETFNSNYTAMDEWIQHQSRPYNARMNKKSYVNVKNLIMALKVNNKIEFKKQKIK